MEKESYHTHTTISDGKLTPRELIESAISKGFKTLAITDHYPRPKKSDSTGWSDNFYTDEHYLELFRLKEEYKEKIKILVGVEFEWFPDKKEWVLEQVKKRDYDIKLISIHKIPVDGKYYLINYTREYFEEALDAAGGDIRKLVEIYYSLVRDAVESGLFDIVSHLDVIKTLNDNSRYFSEDEDWYQDEIFKTLDVIASSGMKMEVNLQLFLSDGKEQWPSKWIIE